MIQRKLEGLETEQGIKIDGTEWLVTEKEVYQDNENETDIQWILEHGSEERFLILSQSKQGKTFRREILLTRGIDTEAISYKTGGDLWEAFQETNALESAPKEVKMGNIVYCIDDETSDEAVDDDGNTVTRLTWDYYDVGKTQNLAIEVWKEPDADYYEAYLGNLFRENDLIIVDKPSVTFSGSDTKNKWIRTSFLVVFVSFIASAMFELPFDITFASIIAFAILYSYISTYSKTFLIRFLFLLTPIIIPLLIYKVSSLIYLLVYAAVSSIVCNLWRSDSETKDAKRRINASCHLTFLSLWIASFINYYAYSPSPHYFSQFAITAIVPIIYSAATFLVLKLTVRDPA